MNMAPREFLSLVRRNRWLVVLVPLVCAAAAFGASTLQPSLYDSTAWVLLRPNDPSEQLGSQNGSIAQDPSSSNSDRYVAAQADVVESPAVLEPSAAKLGDVSVEDLERRIHVNAATNANIIRIRSATSSAATSQSEATTVANEFIEYRRRVAVAGLERAVVSIDTQLVEVQAALIDLARRSATSSPEPDVLAQLDTSKLRYQSLSDRKQELEININLKRGEAELIRPAKLAKSPSSPKPIRNAVIGAIGGLLLALGAAFARDFFDTKVRSRDDVETESGLVTLAEVPRDKRSVKNPRFLATRSDPYGEVAESVRSLRVGVRFLGLDKAISMLLVTPSSPGEGKSLVAANLAASYAESGQRCLLISGDLRRPRVEEMFVGSATVGLTDAVADLADRSRGFNHHGQFDIFSYADQGDLEGLWIIRSGTPSPNPVETLGSRAMVALLNVVREHFDVVVIDSPPILPVADALELAPLVDGVLLVVASGQTTRQSLRRTRQLLSSEQIHLLGTVVNRVAPHAKDGRSGYGYGYGQGKAGTPARVDATDRGRSAPAKLPQSQGPGWPSPTGSDATPWAARVGPATR